MSAQMEDQGKKEIEDNASRLVSLLREEGNQQCADCAERAPKWASWSLGVFICLQCTGLHRNYLGAHISKLKSVKLDAWTEEQVANMEQMGNIKANKIYEAKLPADFDRPKNEAERKSFIIDKYERRKYMSTNKADYSLGSPATNGGESTSSEKTAEEWKFAAVRLEKLQLVNGNDRCADCGKVEPKWASWNLGVLICYECAGMHRCVLGGYISKLRSLEGLTPWTEEEVANLEQIGNIKANARYEAFLPEAFERPRHNEALMKSFIKDKYELRKYMSANMSDFIGIPPKQGESSSSEKGSCCNVL